MFSTDQPAQVSCEACSDIYCEVCFAAQHRKGSRKSHTIKPLPHINERTKTASTHVKNGRRARSSDNSVGLFYFDPYVSFSISCVQMDVEDTDVGDSDDHLQSTLTGTPTAESVKRSKIGEWFVERSKFIPLRLSLPERKYLRLLEAALTVSEYTDKIDTIGFGLSKAKRIVHQIRELCAIMSGLVLSADYRKGQELFADRDFEMNADFYQHASPSNSVLHPAFTWKWKHRYLNSAGGIKL